MWQGRQRASRLWCGVPYCDLHEAGGQSWESRRLERGALGKSFLKEVT